MAQIRFDNHKYARLNNQDDALNQQRTFSDNDEDNEEIELGSDQARLRYTPDGEEDFQNKDHGTNLPANGYLNNPLKTPAERDIDTIPQASTLSGRLNNSRFMQMAIGSLATILLYLTLSICLIFYQKALIKELKFPLSIVCYHLVTKLILATCVRAIYRCHMEKTRVQLDWHTSVRKMAPTGIASGIDIGFSNWGLELVPISLYTMTKSSTIVFILIFAILLGLEKKNWSLVFIVSLIAVGLFMFTYKSTQFDALGFIFILVASLSGGIRWSLAQFIMQKSKLGLHNPIDMIYHMQPWMILSLLPFLIAFEGEKLLEVFANLGTNTETKISVDLFKISFGAVLAFFMEVSEFLVLSKTSSLTLSIAGIFKDIFQLALAVELNGDQLTLINVLGLIVCLAGICCHLLHKYSMLTKIEDFQTYDEANEMHFNENSVNASTASTNVSGINSESSSSSFSFLNKQHSSQMVPLLEETDSEDDGTDHNGPKVNSSDVIFDILKRRDMPR
uniref:Sugar phosphate transporter domain-containing protein n=1 Tax=Glossina brevipalpis TaxID=37001 RepID=A0A1A9WCR2_9MUSC